MTLDDSWDLALKIHGLAEIGSAEVQSSKLLIDLLRANGFEVEHPYKGIPTAFRAETRAGSGTPTVAFLAEYDALRGIGHACGHNLIASSVVSAAIKVASTIHDGRVVVIGTPDEEGSGEYAGSKILLADRGAFADVDFVIMSHPAGRWSVAGQTLAVQDIEVTFHGVAAHSAAAPQDGRSALDAAMLTYAAVNMLRQHTRRDANVVIHGILREGGQASNVTPDKAVLVYGIRSSDMGYEKTLIERFQEIVKGCTLATGTTADLHFIGPLFSTTKLNRTLAAFAQEALVKQGVHCPTVDETWGERPMASSDYGNVSQVLPSIELTFAIAPEGTPWHSHQSLEAARSPGAKEPLGIAIEAMADVAARLFTDPGFGDAAKREFAAP